MNYDIVLRTEHTVKMRCKQFRVDSMLPQDVRRCECEVQCSPVWHTRNISILYGDSVLSHELICQIVPSRRSICEKDGPVTAHVVRDLSLYQVANNTVVSATMREPLEMMVTSRHHQFQSLLFFKVALTPVAYVCIYISDITP